MGRFVTSNSTQGLGQVALYAMPPDNVNYVLCDGKTTYTTGSGLDLLALNTAGGGQMGIYGQNFAGSPTQAFTITTGGYGNAYTNDGVTWSSVNLGHAPSGSPPSQVSGYPGLANGLWCVLSTDGYFQTTAYPITSGTPTWSVSPAAIPGAATAAFWTAGNFCYFFISGTSKVATAAPGATIAFNALTLSVMPSYSTNGGTGADFVNAAYDGTHYVMVGNNNAANSQTPYCTSTDGVTFGAAQSINLPSGVAQQAYVAYNAAAGLIGLYFGTAQMYITTNAFSTYTVVNAPVVVSFCWINAAGTILVTDGQGNWATSFDHGATWKLRTKPGIVRNRINVVFGNMFSAQDTVTTGALSGVNLAPSVPSSMAGVNYYLRIS
ncbi:MAG: hypothetical protein ACRETW_03695 [Stenotrophobium sp.]